MAAFGVCHDLWCRRSSARSDFRVTRTEYLSPLESDLGEVYCIFIMKSVNNYNNKNVRSFPWKRWPYLISCQAVRYLY